MRRFPRLVRSGFLPLCAIGSALLLGGCTAKSTGRDRDKPIRVVCSVFPIYLFTQQVVGDRPGVEVSLMLPPELGCPHEYTLSPDDLKTVADADVIVLNGAGLEEFTVRILDTNPDAKIVDTSKTVLGIDDEHGDDEDGHDDEHGHDERGHEHEGHAHEHEHEAGDHADHDHHADDEHEGHHHEGGVNPHFFSSPAQAARQVRAIADALATFDPEGAETYRANADRYAGRLEALAEEFRARLDPLPNKRIVTVHEVFDYLARDTGLEIIATLQSLPGHDPAAAEMRELVETLRNSKASAVFSEPQYSTRVAEVIATEAGLPVYALDPIASGPADAPPDYYEKTMRTNLDTLTKALAGQQNEK